MEKKWSEEEFVQYLAKQFPVIGDDAAVIPDGDQAWLVTTDALVEGIHFLREEIPPADLGYKAVAVNVSDIAAMGGEPKYAFLTLAIPNNVERLWIRELVEGIREACNKWAIQLSGGDTVGSKRDLFINIAMIGAAPLAHVKYRSQAKPGDIVCVTGFLGDSAAGLKALAEHRQEKIAAAPLIRAHFRPEPHLKQGRWLGAQKGVHALMDLSDGLGLDLARMLKMSHCGAVIETTQLPLSPALQKICQEQHWDPLELAISGGEDYCLLCSISKEEYPKLSNSKLQAEFGCPLFPIGAMIESPLKLIYQREGQPIHINCRSYNHFEL